MALILFLGSGTAIAQEVVDRFNRSDNNTVGGSWTETESGGSGARIAGNALRLQETANASARQYVSRTTPGTYDPILSQNNCTMTWAFSFRQTVAAPSGFDGGDNGIAVVLAASNATLTDGSGYAVVFGDGAGNDELRLVRYVNGLDVDGNLTNIIAAGDFGTEYLDVRVTYEPSTNSWSLYYRNNGANPFGDPLTASTLAGTAVNSTYTGISLPVIGMLWNHSGTNGTFADFDNFYIPSGRPTAPVMTPTSATICNGTSTGLAAATSSTSTTRVTFSSSGGPSTVSATGANDGSVYPWTITTSGLPTSGVVVESVTLNGVTHTYPDDLDILLQSPTGTNVVLMSDVGGAPNISNLSFSFMDGSPAIADGSTSNFGTPIAGGLYSPTNIGASDDYPTAPGPGNGFSQGSPTLGLFTGNMNGAWDLLIRDGFNNDNGQVGSWSITLTYTSTVSYTWAPGGSLNSTTTASVTASPTATTTYTVTAGHSANACTTTNTVPVTVVNPPTTATVGAAQSICTNGVSTGLGGNTPVSGTGAWSVFSGGTGTFSPNNTTPNATFTHTGGAGPIVARWTITGTSPCVPSTADVNLTITTPPSATISYGGLPYCQSASTVNVVRTGTAGGGYTAAPAGLALNASTGEVNLATSTTGTYTVTYTIAAAGGCPIFTTTANITINAAPTRYQDSDADGFGDPGAFIVSCSAVAGYVLDNTDNCPSLFGKIGDSCNDGDANTIADVITGACVCAGTNTPWYSQGSGSFTDAIWSHNVGGPGAVATINAGSDVVVQSGHTITAGAAQAIRNLTVENGATMSLGSNTLTVNGASCQIDGTLNGGTGNLLLQPGTAGTLSGSGSLDINDLTVSASAGLTCSANASIRGTLQLNDGTFTAGGTVQLVSNASGTGRLGPVAATASYAGNLTVNRFIPAGRTNWRMMGSSVGAQTLNNWKDDYTTAGFPGSHAPTFSNPVGSGNLWPSIRWYNESNPGATVMDGLMGATMISQPLTAGQGFAAWCGTGLNTTAAFTVDITGNPNVASSPITLPMSYTNTGVPATDGWNMVSNPLPSPILFSNISRGANVEDYITYFNPITGNNAVYSISLGGSLGATDVIQSGQAFWLKANGPAVTTTVEESDKTASNGGGFFGGDEVQNASTLRLRLASLINQYSDETLVVFSQGSPETNGDDVPKFIFAHPEAPQVATMGTDGSMIAINAYGQYTTDITIPVMVNVAVNGDYTITASGLDMVGLSCLRLEDLATGDITPLTEGASYTFTALASDDETEPRLLLHASAPLALEYLDATCNGRDDGSASVEVTSGPVDIQWMDANGLVLLEQNNVPAGPSAIVALEAGEYRVNITSGAGCGNLITDFTIDEPSAIEITADATPTSCPDSEDGGIDLMVLGGQAPYTYLWSTGSEDSSIGAAAGTYSVEVTDAAGCSLASQEYVVSAGEGPEAGISVESSTVMVDDEVTFFSAGDIAFAHSWDFGDGNTSEELEPVHSYATPGTYTVTLTVNDGTCSTTTTIDMVVESTTGVPTIVGATLNAWVSGDFFVIDHNFTNNEPVLVRILGTNGQLLQQHRIAAAPARITLSNADLATGIYLVRVSNGSNVRTFSLPVTR